MPDETPHPIIVFEEPLRRVIMDCLGPLSRAKSGNEYRLTIMCASSGFPETILLLNVSVKTVVKVPFLYQSGINEDNQEETKPNFYVNLFSASC